MTSLETVFADIKITFFTDVWCFCFFIFACTIFFINTSSWVHELVQPYLDNTANPNLEAYITRCQRPSIPSVMLSGKNFPSSNYPTRCVIKVVLCVLMKRIMQVNMKKHQTSGKSCFEQYHTRSQPKRK